LLAVRQLGRRAFGVEQSEAYCALAVDRLPQTALDFAAAAVLPFRDPGPGPSSE
jgi:hypothetical protein